MRIIDQIHEDVLQKTAQRCRERNIIIPTFAQQRDPSLVPESIRRRLPEVGLWDVDPINLFRITWKNDPQTGLYNRGNWIEFPRALTGTDARIIGLVGKWFPTGAHKVGAGFGCLVPRLVSGNFDPTSQRAVWPSTGNFCRGGAFDCALLACTAVAILPEEMSQERFSWLRSIGAEVFATPGCESNVKEIYDKCWELRRTEDDVVIFNQFEEFGNPIWHYWNTGSIIQELFEQVRAPDSRMAGYVSATGSAGTIAAGDYLREHFPLIRVGASEALQCPTLLEMGFGGHRIEGIGDKHVPWVHNVRNTDMVIAVDDQQTIDLMRLFNEPEGRALLRRAGVAEALVENLGLLGISSISNLVSSIKMARYYEMGSRDIIFTPLTDSMEMYGSRIDEENEKNGPYTERDALGHKARWLDGISTDHLRELNFADRRALHNFKYYTWVEQQQRGVDELRELWDPDFWEETWAQVGQWDELIQAFNAKVGLL
ncbi:MAG: pyridoxal-phosphate dependent enzyme [Pseudomonadota bacterium]